MAFSNCWNNSLQKSQALSALRLASEALAEHRTNATGEAAAPLHFMAGKTLLGYARNRSLLEWEQVGAPKNFFQKLRLQPRTVPPTYPLFFFSTTAPALTYSDRRRRRRRRGRGVQELDILVDSRERLQVRVPQHSQTRTL